MNRLLVWNPNKVLRLEHSNHKRIFRCCIRRHFNQVHRNFSTLLRFWIWAKFLSRDKSEWLKTTNFVSTRLYKSAIRSKAIKMLELIKKVDARLNLPFTVKTLHRSLIRSIPDYSWVVRDSYTLWTIFTFYWNANTVRFFLALLSLS